MLLHRDRAKLPGIEGGGPGWLRAWGQSVGLWDWMLWSLEEGAHGAEVEKGQAALSLSP